MILPRFCKENSVFTAIALAFVMLTAALILNAQPGGVTAAKTPTKDREVYAYHDLFLAVYDKIVNYYVDETDRIVLLEGALQGMCTTLDRNNMYLRAADLEKRFTETMRDNQYGLVFGVKVDKLQVIAVLPGSPAEDAGLRSGDWIWSIGDMVVGGMPSLLENYKQLLHQRLFTTSQDEERETGVIITGGEQVGEIDGGLKVPANLEQPEALIDANEASGDEKGFMITWLRGEKDETVMQKALVGERKVIQPLPAVEMIEKPVTALLIRLSEIKTAEQFQEIVESKILSMPRSTPILLDCRQVYHLQPDAAIKIAACFLEQGQTIASLTLPRGETVRTHTASASGICSRLNTAVLIDGGTAGGVEIIAAALAANGTATLVGSPTFGYAFEQTGFPVKFGGEIRIVTGIYRDAKGAPLYPESRKPGISLDNELEPTAWRTVHREKKFADDPVISAALKALLENPKRMNGKSDDIFQSDHP